MRSRTRTWPPPGRWCWRPSGPALDRAWADRAARVELVQFTGAGVDRGAAAFTGRPGVVVANVPAANAREVAEYVLLATGSLLRGLALADREIRAGRYREVRGRLTPAAVRSLHSATVGVVGLGQIGLAAARLFQAVGAQVSYSDPAPRDPAAAAALGPGPAGPGRPAGRLRRGHAARAADARPPGA